MVEAFTTMIWRPQWTLRCLLGAFITFQVALSQVIAQQTPESSTEVAPQGQSSTDQTLKGIENPPPDPNKPQNDRLFFTFPNYLTVEKASSLPPLTVKQKFKYQALGTFDPVELTYIAVAASINQASNSEPAYGQGFVGYAKRYGTSFADTIIGNFGTGAVFPSLLHQDPRYYQLGKGKFLHRAKYAGLRIFVTRSDSGKNEFNFSEFLGIGMAAAIANAYHPAPRTFMNSVSICGTQIAWDALAYEVKEFWPDVHNKVHRHASTASQ